jgi:hypothetical protein
MIAILCPTRARPEQCKRMIESAYATAKADLNIWLSYGADTDLPSGPAYTCVRMPENYPTSQKWNDLSWETMLNPHNKLFMLAADDMVFTTPSWDKAIIDHYNALPEGRKAHVYALQDSRDQAGTPHIIATREYIEALGFFVPPIFLHWYVDSWTVEIAKSSGCFTHFKDYGLTHIKPSDQGQGDETHNRIRSFGWRERDAYVAETCRDWLQIQKQKLRHYCEAP